MRGRIANDIFIATPGASIVIPVGTMHTMWNETDRRVRFLSVIIERHQVQLA